MKKYPIPVRVQYEKEKKNPILLPNWYIVKMAISEHWFSGWVSPPKNTQHGGHFGKWNALQNFSHFILFYLLIFCLFYFNFRIITNPP